MKIFFIVFAFFFQLFLPQIIFAQSSCPLSEANTKSNEELINNCSIAELSTLSNERLSSFSLDFLSRFSNERLLQFSNDFLVQFPSSILKQFPQYRIKTFPCEIQQQLGYSCGVQNTNTTPSPTIIPTIAPATPMPGSSSVTPLPKKPVKIIISQLDRPDQILDPSNPNSLAKINLNFASNGIANVRFQVDYDSSGQDTAIYYVQYKLKQQSTLPSPDSSGITHLTSCGEITKPGNYVLDQNLIDKNNFTCLNIHDVEGVNLDCNNYSVNNVSSAAQIQLQKVKNFSIKSCKIIQNSQNSLVTNGLLISNSSTGSIISNTIQNGNVIISNSDNIIFKNNTLTSSGLWLISTNDSIVDSNNLTLSENDSLIPEIFKKKLIGGIFIRSQGGYNNQIINNIIDGKSDGILANLKGADDGISLGSEHDTTVGERSAIVKNNTIKNVFDCGIETGGLVQSSIISNNKIDNAGYCGIGGWYSSSWKGNIVSENTANNSPSLLIFFLVARDSQEPSQQPQVYFIDNTFDNNKLTNQRFPAQNPVIMDLEYSSIMKGNNLLSGNDFELNNIPALFPGTMIVDGGNNVCLQATYKDFPLKCSGSQETDKKFRILSQLELEAEANNAMQTIISLTKDSNRQLPNFQPLQPSQPTPTSTPEPLKLIDFNGDGVINIFDYIIFAQKKIGL